MKQSSLYKGDKFTQKSCLRLTPGVIYENTFVVIRVVLRKYHVLPPVAQTDRQADRQNDRETNRQADRQNDRETNRQADKQKDRETNRQNDKKTGRQTVTETSYQDDRLIG